MTDPEDFDGVLRALVGVPACTSEASTDFVAVLVDLLRHNAPNITGLAEWDIDTITLDPESDGDLDILYATITAGTRRRMVAACERDRHHSGQCSYAELSITVTHGQLEAELPSSRTVKQHGHGNPTLFARALFCAVAAAREQGLTLVARPIDPALARYYRAAGFSSELDGDAPAERYVLDPSDDAVLEQVADFIVLAHVRHRRDLGRAPPWPGLALPDI